MANVCQVNLIAGRKGRCWVSLISAGFLLSQTAAAATYLDTLYLTFDTPMQSTAGMLPRQQALKTGYAVAPQAVALGLPSNVAITAFSTKGSNFLYVPNVPLNIAGSVATPRDIVQYANGASSFYLSGSTLGLPATAKIDALALAGTDVLFSLASQALVSGIKVGPGDVLHWDGNTVSMLYSTQTLGLPTSANLTGLEYLSSGRLLMNFEAPGSAGDVTYRAGEILEYAHATASWSLLRNQGQLDVTCSPCRTRDFAAVANFDVIFRNGYDQY